DGIRDRNVTGVQTWLFRSNVTGTKCPRCDELMLEIENRQGKMLRCKDRSCNYKKNIYKNTNARCPNCKKKLKLYREGKGQTFRRSQERRVGKERKKREEGS